MRYFFVLIYFLTCINIQGQNSKLLVVLDPMDCGNCIRRVDSQIKHISKNLPVIWLMEESYKNQIGKLEKQLQIEIGNNVIFSDSLYSLLSQQGSVFAMYKGSSLAYTYPTSRIDKEHITLINSMIDSLSSQTLFQFPDSLTFSKFAKIKGHKNNYLLIDNLYNELTFLSNDLILKISGKTFFTKDIYYKTFHDKSYYDSLSIRLAELKKMAYDEIKIMNATFGDSTIELLCNFPIIIQLQQRSGVSLSPAIITLNKNLELVKIRNLNDFSVKNGSIAKYYLSTDFFEYYKGRYYFSYMPDIRKKLDKKVYAFASLEDVKEDSDPKMNFLNITYSRDLASTLSIFINSYISPDLPFIYNPLLPIEFNLESSTKTDLGMQDFSYKELSESTKNRSKFSDLFHMSTIYRTDNFLVALYRKRGKNIKEIYNLANHKQIYHYQYKGEIVNKVDGVNSNFTPIDLNKFVYLNGKNQLIEVAF